MSYMDNRLFYLIIFWYRETISLNVLITQNWHIYTLLQFYTVHPGEYSKYS